MISETKIDKLSDEEFSQIVATSFSIAEVGRKLGYFAQSGTTHKRIKKRIDELNLSTSHFSRFAKEYIARCFENIFIEDSTADQKTLRKYYARGNYTDYICAICGQEPFWQNKPLTLILDHINGHNNDNRLENLRWVCPNCNQQLDTTGGKNIKKLKLQN